MNLETTLTLRDQRLDPSCKVTNQRKTCFPILQPIPET